MADISDVNVNEIKDLYESLESLNCKSYWTVHRTHFDHL